MGYRSMLPGIGAAAPSQAADPVSGKDIAKRCAQAVTWSNAARRAPRTRDLADYIRSVK